MTDIYKIVEVRTASYNSDGGAAVAIVIKNNEGETFSSHFGKKFESFNEADLFRDGIIEGLSLAENYKNDLGG